MDTIKDIIPGVIDALAQKKPKTQQDIQDLWQRITQTQRGSAVVKIDKGCLTVHVDSSARMFQYNAKRTYFLNELKKIIPDIQRIYFKLGKTT